MTTDRKRQRDRLARAEQRRLDGLRRDLDTRWHAMEQAERERTMRMRELGELRAVLEAERALYLEQESARARNAREYNNAIEWQAAHWAPIQPADRNALRVVWWLDCGRAWVSRLGGGAASRERVAEWFTTWTRGTALATIPAHAWAVALATWRGWTFGARKSGKPPRSAAGATYRPDALVLDLLRAGSIKQHRPRKNGSTANRDAEGLRAKVNRAVKAVKSDSSARSAAKV